MANEEKLCIIHIVTTLFPSGNKLHFYIFAMLGIIRIGLYLLSRLQNPSWQIVDRLSQTYEKGIFYGAVLARGGIFFMN